jgi:transcriptional regulator with XRE-family HTH domain
MGKGKRVRPRSLGRKMRIIRETLGLSQNEMLRRLQLEAEFTRSEISAYERGIREPPAKVLLRYSAVARVWVNVLIDDDLNLPSSLPAKAMHAGISRATTKHR